MLKRFEDMTQAELVAAKVNIDAALRTARQKLQEMRARARAHGDYTDHEDYVAMTRRVSGLSGASQRIQAEMGLRKQAQKIANEAIHLTRQQRFIELCREELGPDRFRQLWERVEAAVDGR